MWGHPMAAACTVFALHARTVQGRRGALRALRPDLRQFGLQDLPAAVRAAIDHHDAVVLPLVTLNDKGIPIFHRQEMDFTHSNRVMLQI